MKQYRKYTENNTNSDDSYVLVVIVALVVALWLSSCTVNKHGIFIGDESQKTFNKSLQYQSQQLRNVDWEVK